MSAIALRGRIIRRRRHLTTMAAVLAIAVALAVHHSDMAPGDTHEHDGMSAAIVMCLGVLTAVGTAVAAIALGVLALGRWRPGTVLAATGLALHARPPIPRARAGPPLLSLLCVSRR